MADENQLKLILEGVKAWNNWRIDNPNAKVVLSGAHLIKADFSGANLMEADLLSSNLGLADLRGADLRGANLNGAILLGADLRGANLNKAILLGSDLGAAKLGGADLRSANLMDADLSTANLCGADLRGTKLRRADLGAANLMDANLRSADFMDADLKNANFRKCNLSRASLRGADLYKADFSSTNLTGAHLQNARLVETNLEQAVFANCKIYGISAWALKGTPANQSSLVITSSKEEVITVDDLQVAQFVYLLLNNQNVRNVLDTVTSKAVLILGRFTPERKAVLNALAGELRKYNLIPIIFDFERSASRDFTETIKALASLSLFIIADITNPSSSPLELQATGPDYQIPFVPIIQTGERPFSMFRDLIGKYDWVLNPVITYTSVENLVIGFKSAILDRAWAKHQELQKRKAQATEVLSIDDYLKQ